MGADDVPVRSGSTHSVSLQTGSIQRRPGWVAALDISIICDVLRVSEREACSPRTTASSIVRKGASTVNYLSLSYPRYYGPVAIPSGGVFV